MAAAFEWSILKNAGDPLPPALHKELYTVVALNRKTIKEYLLNVFKDMEAAKQECQVTQAAVLLYI